MFLKTGAYIYRYMLDPIADEAESRTGDKDEPKGQANGTNARCAVENSYSNTRINHLHIHW